MSDKQNESGFLDTSDKELNKDLKNLNKQRRYIVWVQEFSKKIVVVTSLIYIATSIFLAILVYLSFQSDMISGMDTLIVETNNTFREIIGGYIIKAAVENAVKIGGSYYTNISKNKLKALELKIKQKYPDIDLETDEFEIEEV